MSDAEPTDVSGWVGTITTSRVDPRRKRTTEPLAYAQLAVRLLKRMKAIAEDALTDDDATAELLGAILESYSEVVALERASTASDVGELGEGGDT